MDIENKILSIMEISPAVSDFIDEGSYLHPDEDTTGRSLSDVLIDCMNMIFNELKEMGITSFREEELLTDGYHNEAAINLRALFDEDKLKKYITYLSADEREIFRSLLDEKDPDAETNLFSIVDFMEGRGVLSTSFDRIKECISDYQLAPLFYLRIKGIMDNNTFPPQDIQETQALIVQYLTHEQAHINCVKKAMEFLANVIPKDQYDPLELKLRLSIHDGDLIYGSSIEEAARMWSIKKQIKPNPEMLQMALKFKENHFYRNKHHMSYFEGKEASITMLDLMEIAADRYDEQPTKQEYLNDVQEVFTKVKLSEETKTKILEVANQLNIW